MELIKKYKRYIPLILLIIFTVIIWFFVFDNGSNSKYLKVVFLDVGQGDSIYIETPSGKQVLIDGGPDARILSSLSKVMPFADRSIDMVVETHPDLDHIGGLPLVLSNYKISTIVENGAGGDSKTYIGLESLIQKKKINKLIARRGMRFILDEKRNIYFDIIYPDRDPSKLDSNEGSIVGRLVYGSESFMLTGDADLYVENIIKWNEGRNNIKSNVLKLGHHGSHTSNGELWLEEVDPDIAIISVDKNNKYGHPHKDVLDRLSNLKIPYLSTADKGNIVFKTDGVNLLYTK